MPKDKRDIVLLICRRKEEKEKKEKDRQRGKRPPDVKTVVTYGTDESHPLYDVRQMGVDLDWFRNWTKTYQLKALAERTRRESKLSPFKHHDLPMSPKWTPDEAKYDNILTICG